MSTSVKTSITVETIVNAPIEKVWNTWISPEHIVQWCTGSADWHTPKAENDLRIGGQFTTRMEAKDGSFGFDFGGVYDNIKTNELIKYTIGDGRKVSILFAQTANGIKITEMFEAEDINPVEMQQGGWQTILNNFKSHTELLAN